MASKSTGDFNPQRGDVYWVKPDVPVVGHEQMKERPCVIVSSNSVNAKYAVITVAPITKSVSRIYAVEVPCLVRGIPGKILLNQCRGIDKSRLGHGKKVCTLDGPTMEDVDEALRAIFDLPCYER